MMKKKILFVLPTFSLSGTTISMVGILNSSLSKEYDMDCFAIVHPRKRIAPLSEHDIGMNSLTTALYGNFKSFSFGEKLKHMPLKLILQLPFLRSRIMRWGIHRTIDRIEKTKHYDCVVGFQEGRATHLASLFKTQQKIAWVHCDYAEAIGYKENDLNIYKQYSKIICVSNFTHGKFIDLYPSIAKKTYSIHNVIDAKHVLKQAESHIDDPLFDTSFFTILSLGRICPVKRFEKIPDIVAYLSKKKIKLKWYILGNAEENESLEQLKKNISEKGMALQVVYLGAKSNPYPYLKAADLMVSLSISEACPMIFNEAKILGVPIVTTDFGSAFEFIENGRDGYIASFEDIPQTLFELIETPSRLESIRSIKPDNTNQEIIKQLRNLFSQT